MRFFTLTLLLVATIVAPLAGAQMWGCGSWTPDACPPPSLTIHPIGPFDDCVTSGQVAVDTGTGYVSTISITIANASGGVVHEWTDSWGAYGTWWHGWAFGPAWDFGTYAVTVSATNPSGSDTQTSTFVYSDYVDITAPVTTPDISSYGSPPPVEGWYRGNVRIHLMASDDCGWPEVRAWMNGTPTSFYQHLYHDGAYDLSFQAVDKHGNVEELREVFIGIDRAPPTVEVTKPAQGDFVLADQSVILGAPTTIVVGPVTLEAAAEDALSGVAQVTWLVDGVVVGHGASLAYTFTQGEHEVVARAADVAGNEASSTPVRVLAL